jgi:hypothetical protein
MKLRRFVAVVMMLTAVALGFGSTLEADASGAPRIIRRILIPVDANCTITWIDYSNGDWDFILGPGC